MATGIFRKNFPQVDKLQKKVDEADYIIGLDLHKKTTAITVVDVSQPEQPVFRRKRLKNNELIEVLKLRQPNGGPFCIRKNPLRPRRWGGFYGAADTLGSVAG